MDKHFVQILFTVLWRRTELLVDLLEQCRIVAILRLKDLTGNGQFHEEVDVLQLRLLTGRCRTVVVAVAVCCHLLLFGNVVQLVNH